MVHVVLRTTQTIVVSTANAEQHSTLVLQAHGLLCMAWRVPSAFLAAPSPWERCPEKDIAESSARARVCADDRKVVIGST